MDKNSIRENTLESIRLVIAGKSNRIIPEGFIENLEDLFKILFEAYSNYEIWWIHVNKDDRSKYFFTKLRYKDFFETVAYANITAMIIALYKLFDKNKKSLSLRKIIRDAQKLKIIEEAGVNTLNRSVEKVDSIWSKVMILRSNLFAHRSDTLTVNEIYKKAKITPNQMKELMEVALEILNSICLKTDKSKRRFEDFVARDTYNVLNALKYIETKRQK